MRIQLNNRGRFSSIGLLIFLLLLSLLFYSLALGYYSAKYTESAHGNSPSGAGVNRTSLSTPPNNYARGNCAHCHEQHGSIGGEEPAPGIDAPNNYLLFAEPNVTSQDNNFCYQCHMGSGSVQVGGITNYTYSKNFGGGNPTFTTIYDAFNPTTGATHSSHNLSDILSHAVKRNIGFTNDNNACVVCHNPHTAQRNYPVTLTGMGGVKTTIRTPLDYQNNTTNLWGDEDFATSGYRERMLDYDSSYQAPYYKGGAPNNYEPANNNTNDGSNLPNFVKFCSNQCHSQSNVYSTERSRNLTEIDWSNSGDHHGRNFDTSRLGVTIAPYGNSNFNYVLSCTDCHEGHGSKNEWLLRTCVNGKDDISVPGPNRWLDFCTACHTVPQHTSPWDTTTDCYNNGICHHHGNFF
jgi:hypothetical protein